MYLDISFIEEILDFGNLCSPGLIIKEGFCVKSGKIEKTVSVKTFQKDNKFSYLYAPPGLPALQRNLGVVLSCFLIKLPNVSRTIQSYFASSN